MWVLYILSLLGILVQILFLLVAIASGLYYLAEVVEENTEITKKVIRWLTIGILIIYVGLMLFEELPSDLILCGILGHIVHLVILIDFPFISVYSFSFVGAVILFVLNHYFAFSFFGSNFIPFYELLGFFTICIWLIPFALFISLSANDNILPVTFFGAELHNPTSFLGVETDALGNYLSKKKNRYGLLSFLHYVKDRVFPRNKKMF